jgi:tRNA pseudouridine55 synthase
MHPIPSFTPDQLSEGFTLLIDKPLHWTSFDAVNKLKSLCKHRWKLPNLKIGHAGTLDPLATGLLVICTGKHTKQIDKLQAETKTYTGIFRMGATTPSYDLETDIDEEFETKHINGESMENAVNSLTGKIEQIPPAFSAIKVDGKRVYKKARAGQTVDLPARPVEILSFSIETLNFPDIHFYVQCSKGTYIRSLVHDFGKRVESGAHLIELRRTHSGHFDVKDAFSIDGLEEYFTKTRLD